MKIALLGTGKTGSLVQSLHGEENCLCFNRSHPPNVEEIKEQDAVISFLPGGAFVEYLHLLYEARVPVVSGSTGDLPLGAIDQELKKRELSWVHANNFSVAMVAVKAMIEKISGLKNFEDFSFSMKETHHTQKLDAPSGTAKSWKEWLGVENCPIESVRESDVVGVHQLFAHSKLESIELKHSSHSRELFARGALWAAQDLVENPPNPGLTPFSRLVEAKFSFGNGER